MAIQLVDIRKPYDVQLGYLHKEEEPSSNIKQTQTTRQRKGAGRTRDMGGKLYRKNEKGEKVSPHRQGMRPILR